MDHPSFFGLVVLALITMGAFGWQHAKIRRLRADHDDHNKRLRALEERPASGPVLALPVTAPAGADLGSEPVVRATLERLTSDHRDVEDRLLEAEDAIRFQNGRINSADAKIATLEKKSGAAWSAYAEHVARRLHAASDPTPASTRRR